MKKSILVGLVALSLAACAQKEEAVVEETPVVAEDAAAPADAAVVEAPASEVVDEAPVAQ